MKFPYLLPLLLSALFLPGLQAGMDVSRHNVVWHAPSRTPIDSMPLGNGLMAINAWVNEAGHLQFYVSRGDAWSADHILLTLGQVEIRFENRSRGDLLAHFRQELDLATGTILIQLGEGSKRINLRLWLDATAPDLDHLALHVNSETPFGLQVESLLWRNERREFEFRSQLAEKAYHLSFGPRRPALAADTRFDAGPQAIGWYHANTWSLFPENLALQDLSPWNNRQRDPLLNRISGCIVGGEGLRTDGLQRLATTAPVREQVLHVVTHTAIEPDPNNFARALQNRLQAAMARDLNVQARQHLRWWKEFWQRSWIEIGANGQAQESFVGLPILAGNEPIRIGGDAARTPVFAGEVASVAIFDAALGENAMQRLAAAPHAQIDQDYRPLVHWDFRTARQARPGSIVAMDLAGGMAIGSGGGVTLADTEHGRSTRFDGTGIMQAVPITHQGLAHAMTVAAWIRPAAIPAHAVPLVDQSSRERGVMRGFTLAIGAEASLRYATANGVIQSQKGLLQAGEWTHVAASYDATDGSMHLFVNGHPIEQQQGRGPGLTGDQLEALQTVAAETMSDSRRVSRAYQLQRAVNAFAGRSPYPIKFNGSLFAVPADDQFAAGLTPDHRRWGGPYWFQNTRLAYWPMFYAGDFDLLPSMLEFYAGLLPFYQFRTKDYFGHQGAQFLEMTYIWGGSPEAAYGFPRGTGVVLERSPDLPREVIRNAAHRYHFNGGLELSAMLLDYHAFTQDRAFLENTLLPVADAVVTFFMLHYPRKEGLLWIEPSQALESYHDTVNPLPEVAGLRWVLQGLLNLPENLTRSRDRQRWRGWLAELPPIPLREMGGAPALSPAKIMRQEPHNFENPELYAIFPYRIFGTGKPDIEIAQNAFDHRRVKGNYGWDQSAIQAAYLGQSEFTWELVSRRARMVHGDTRWPVGWQAAFNQTPDQDHAGVFQIALQRMLLQTDGERILLLPAWPADKDVSFRLNAPGRTSVEVNYRNGRIERMEVSPSERKKDIILPDFLQQ